MVKSFNFSNLFSTLESSSSDGFNVEENIDDINAEVVMLFKAPSVDMTSLEEFFITTHRNGAWCQFFSRPKCWGLGILATLCTTPRLFKTLTNFTSTKFEELTTVVRKIIFHARSTKEVCKLSDRPCKSTPKQCLLNFILYFKHDKVTMHDEFMCNQFKASICDDALFIFSCSNETIVDEIQWSIVKETLLWQEGSEISWVALDSLT